MLANLPSTYKKDELKAKEEADKAAERARWKLKIKELSDAIDRPLGSVAYRNGEKVLWAGQEWNYQTPGSFNELIDKGEIKIDEKYHGEIATDNALKTLSRTTGNISNDLEQHEWGRNLKGNLSNFAKGAGDVYDYLIDESERGGQSTTGEWGAWALGSILRDREKYAKGAADLLSQLKINGKGIDPRLLQIGTEEGIDALLTLGAGNLSRIAFKSIDKLADSSRAIKGGSQLKPVTPSGVTTPGVLEMTTSDAQRVYDDIIGKAKEKSLKVAERNSDLSLSKIGRELQKGNYDQLAPRYKKMISATDEKSNPLRYLIKYSGNSIMKADSHHILDIDFWGRALAHKDADVVSHVLWKKGVRTGNNGNNIVWAWSTKHDSFDHNTLHRLYENLESRKAVETLMANGQWSQMDPKTAALLLREVAYDQHRLTNNFFRVKLDRLKTNYPDLADLTPAKLRSKILEDPVKYGNLAVINPRDGDQLMALADRLTNLKYSGGSSKELRVVFGLDTPKAGAIDFRDSVVKTDFLNGLDHRIKEALRLRKKNPI